MSEREWAERRVGWARLWARAKQVLTTDPTHSDEDDQVVDEEAARALAAAAGRLKGGLAKVAQLAAYTRASSGARAVLGGLWDRAPAVSGGAIAEVVAQDLGRAPQALFAEWDATPIAAASLGQVHAARLADGAEVVVKVQYPGVAEALRADLDDPGFLRRLAGSEIGRSLDDATLTALADAVRRELDYRLEADAQRRFGEAWQGDAVVRVPRVIGELSSARVLTMERARGKTIVEVAAHGTPELRRDAAAAIYRFAWGSPLARGLVNADPNPGNFLIDQDAASRRDAARPGDGHVMVWCLDFGCALEVPADVRDADLALWRALLDADGERAAERFRTALHAAGLLRRPDSLATHAHRDWERALAAPLATHGDFHWDTAYAAELAASTGRALAAGGLVLPARVLLLWRQRLGAAAVLGLLDASAPFRRLLADLLQPPPYV
ncbi:MAG TPA: AarF/ABC1/UbiB kinase family protein [Kofleriaceae bacterium]|jgi:predicted unusual protein kinase regulating ubiquinone biosynthesis (AarF/ABC1/UbiB family)